MRVLTALSVALAVAVAAVIRILDHERLSALGSILAGAGSLLAVLWFSAGLRYQANQLEEQRKQFAAQFKFLKENSRREALLLVQGILERAEARAIASLGETISIGDLPTKYMDAPELKTVLESQDPREVIDACRTWMKKEGAATTLLQGIKSAAEVYLRSVDAGGVDYSKAPDEFYLVYSPRFANEPFFNTLSGPATLLSEIMVRFKPGREAAIIAFMAATAKAVSPKIIKMEKLREDVARHLAEGRPLPAIAHDV